MSKIHFLYGTVNSAKSTALLVKAHYLEQLGQRILCIKPSEDTRDKGEIVSRSGLKRLCLTVDECIDTMSSVPLTIDILFIDEVQFVPPEKLKFILDYCVNSNIHVFAYGLKSDIHGKLFPGSQIMFENATNLEEIKNYCMACKKHKAIFNVRLDALGKPDFKGPVTQPGFNYAGYCNICYNHVKNG